MGNCVSMTDKDIEKKFALDPQVLFVWMNKLINKSNSFTRSRQKSCITNLITKHPECLSYKDNISGMTPFLIVLNHSPLKNSHRIDLYEILHLILSLRPESVCDSPNFIYDILMPSSRSIKYQNLWFLWMILTIVPLNRFSVTSPIDEYMTKLAIRLTYAKIDTGNKFYFTKVKEKLRKDTLIILKNSIIDLCPNKSSLMYDFELAKTSMEIFEYIDIKNTKALCELKYEETMTPIMVLCKKPYQLGDAAQRLVNSGLSNVAFQCKSTGKTALHLATGDGVFFGKNNNHNSNNNDNNEFKEFNHGFLREYMEPLSITIINFLVNKLGISLIEIANQKDTLGRTPLSNAKAFQLYKVIDLLESSSL